MKTKFLLCFALTLNGYCHAGIVYPKAPDGGQQIVYKNLNPKFLGVSRIEDLTIAEPYREYYVGPTNLAAGQLLTAATSKSWCYVLMRGTNAVGAATVFDAAANTGNVMRFWGLYETDFSKETLNALQQAEQLPQVKKQNYELRRLDIAPILFVAVWLHGKSDDIIIPLLPIFGRWNAYQPYSESQMIKLLQPEAEKKLKEPAGFD